MGAPSKKVGGGDGTGEGAVGMAVVGDSDVGKGDGMTVGETLLGLGVGDPGGGTTNAPP